MIKVVLIDYLRLCRGGIRAILKADASIQIIGEAESGIEGIKLIRSLKPDIAIIDFDLRDISGLEVTRRLCKPNNSAPVKILVTSTIPNDKYAQRLFKIGAKGYINKHYGSEEELIQAVKMIYSGEKFINPKVAKRLAIPDFKLQANDIFSTLTDRETEVMLMVIKRESVKEIAEKMNTRPSTIYSYRKRIFDKLRVHDDIALAFLAIEHGIITKDAI